MERKRNVFTSGMKWSVFTSKSSLEFCEDVKKRLRLLSEERLSPREEKTCVFVRHFFGKKNGGECYFRTHGV